MSLLISALIVMGVLGLAFGIGLAYVKRGAEVGRAPLALQ